MEEFLDNNAANPENVDLMKYVRGVLRRWWLVLACTVLVAAPWYVYLKRQPPTYKADAWLSFENVSGSVSDDLIESRIAKLRSRSFAEEVTAELGLTLKIVNDAQAPLYRQDVFRTFFTTRNPVPGAYELRFHPNGTASIRSETRMLDSARVERFIEDTVGTNGFSFRVNPEVARRRPRVAFLIQNFQSTVEALQSAEDIIPQGRTLMQLTLTDTDPYLAAETINRLADKFVQKSIEIARRASRFNRQYLEEQLGLVQRDLNETDYQLKSFRDTHLQDLDSETRDIVSRMDQNGDRIGDLTVQKKDLGQLLARLDPSNPAFETGVSVRYVYDQIVGFPIFRGDPDMTVASQEWRNKYADLDRMGSAPALNPRVKQINEDLTDIQTTLYSLAQKKLTAIDDSIGALRARDQALQGQLNKLPQEEINFIRLNRQRRANEVIYEALVRNYKEAQINEAVEPENISLYDRAVPPSKPISGDKRKKMAIGVLMGMFLGIGAALMWEIADKRIKSRDDIKRYLKLPILGVIPKVRFDAYELQDSEKAKSISSQIVTHDYSPTPVGEAYRSLRTSILFSKTFGPVKSLVVSSVAPGEGKSFTAANLAITLAQQKSRTMLIDADFRRGVLHNSFNCPKKPGLTNYLTGVASLESVLNETYIPNLTLITCGSMIPNPSELLGSDKMHKFIEGITHRYDFVIFDTPPLFAASDAVILGTLVDGVSLIIRAGMTKRDDVVRKMELFQNVRAKVIGVILNGAGVEVAHEGYSYYAY
jgi:capsular exopolysaccharide synthesis family protein